MKDWKMWIDGKWVDSASGKTYEIFNPATGEKIARAPLGEVSDVDRAVKAASKAFPIWSKKSIAERTALLKQVAANIQENNEEIVQMDILDHGTPIKNAKIYAMVAAMAFDTAGAIAQGLLEEGKLNIASDKLPFMKREPIGVVAGILPWNIPLMVSGKIANALATGNTCVIKPASVDVLGTLQIAQAIEKVSDIPRGAVNVVIGTGTTVGESLASHPGVGMVAFTGSCETGKAIMAAGSKTVKRMFLELGGKNPFIVLEDADIDASVSGAVCAVYANTGMLCGCPGRIYVPEKIHDIFVEKFIAASKKMVVGDPNDTRTDIGPVVSAEHRDKVEKLIAKGIEEGAKLVLGGKRPQKAPLNKGYYILPTVFTNVTQNMALAREEIFGPVAPIIKYKSEDDVLALANDNVFGLAATVWTKDYAKAMRFANALQYGSVGINTTDIDGLPWGGFKESGFGKELGGAWGMQEYTQYKAINMQLG
jgi:aldehyde dehydrogenase (NAD+)